jgi:hypothetical protein
MGGIIKMDLREIGWEGVDWLYLAEGREKWRALAIGGMNLQLRIRQTFLERIINYYPPKKGLCSIINNDFDLHYPPLVYLYQLYYK